MQIDTLVVHDVYMKDRDYLRIDDTHWYKLDKLTGNYLLLDEHVAEQLEEAFGENSY